MAPESSPAESGNDPPPETTAQPPRSHTGIRRASPKTSAVGMTAVVKSLKTVTSQAGSVRGMSILGKLNQKGGFDCPSCAWPDPDGERSRFEFCENGAKAIASETTRARADAAFFERNPVDAMARRSDHWLEQQGRLTHPMVLTPGASHYQPVPWDEAFSLIAGQLRDLDSPDEAVFYTSGRTSNEAAFLYQLMVRSFGTNNLPDCSNMCHESSGRALKETIGVGKGTVSLEDIQSTGLLVLMGQNPGTNHPRMLSALQAAKRNGARIIAVNPLKEAGMLAFAHPQEASGLLGASTKLADRYLQVRIAGDQALLQGWAKALLAMESEAPGTVADGTFIDQHTVGFADWKSHVEAAEWAEIEKRSGLGRREIEESAREIAEAGSMITCWAMGLTQHRDAVATIQEVVNLHLLCGQLGKPGAGVCPVRGHSNVQGDRTVGIWEKMPEAFLEKLEAEFGIDVPREPGWDTVDAIRALRDGRARVFFAMGGNFLSASPDTEMTAEGLRNCDLTVQVSTKLNRSHLVTGKTALILPCLGRSERDEQAGGSQFVSVENSMGVVHSSQGTFPPASDQLRSEPAIVAGLARALLGPDHPVPWEELVADYDCIRERIERVVPGFDHYNERVRRPGGFYLRNPVRERRFETASGKAEFTTHALAGIDLEPGQLLLMTIRSHDQFNTTVYGLDDRYRGIHNERRVILLNRKDMRERGIAAEQPVDITSHFEGTRRVGRLFLAIPYDIPQGMAAAYFPEANVLVPVDSVAKKSNTPTSKSVVVTVAPAG